MKKITILLLISMLIGCTQIKPVVEIMPVQTDSTDYYRAKCDTLTFLASSFEKSIAVYENRITDLSASIVLLNDSIIRLNQRQVMDEAQFVRLYKYDRLLKYYKICKNRPTQWKYYKGWSTRVFEL